MLPHLINADLKDLHYDQGGQSVDLSAEEFPAVLAVLRALVIARPDVVEIREAFEVVALADNRLRDL